MMKGILGAFLSAFAASAFPRLFEQSSRTSGKTEKKSLRFEPGDIARLRAAELKRMDRGQKALRNAKKAMGK